MIYAALVWLGSAIGVAAAWSWYRCRIERGCAAELARALAVATSELARIEQDQRERLHDARSTVAGVTGACDLLARAAASPSIDPTRLRQLIAAELERLTLRLDAEAPEPITDFDLYGCVEPVLLSFQLSSVRLRVDARSMLVRGRPHALAGVLDNLLRNSVVHAPGSVTTVRFASRAGRAVVSVEDDGPGIPAAERFLVVQPGRRGAASAGRPGSGLGLHIAATTMAAMSGAMTIAARPGGGTIVRLELPAVTAGLARRHSLAS
jgi:signal transduction histidine kinase